VIKYQDECIARMVEVVREEHAKEPRTLFVIGAYSIGKVRQNAMLPLPVLARSLVPSVRRSCNIVGSAGHEATYGRAS
jgi:hypothetical protein